MKYVIGFAQGVLVGLVMFGPALCIVLWNAQ
jgi:hypothetical protein